MPAHKIRTYSTESFREKYMHATPQLEALLKSDFDKFFITQVEQLIRLIKLPVPPIRSSSHTFMYLTAGEAVMSVGSMTYTIHQHECLFVPAGQVFSFNNVDENQGFICNFPPDFILGKYGSRDLLNRFEFLQVWGNARVQLNEGQAQQVQALFTRILQEYQERALQQYDLIQAYFLTLLFEIDQAYQPLFAHPQAQSIALSKQFIALVFSQIQSKHLVTDYADLLHLSPNHLNRVIKKITGKSPSKWIDEALLMEAKVLLHQTAYPINQIAHSLNIDDPSYFSRLFKKYTGMTPLQFRKALEK